jgi:hypothetical protein
VGRAVGEQDRLRDVAGVVGDEQPITVVKVGCKGEVAAVR